jgi:cytochrome c peroxidase
MKRSTTTVLRLFVLAGATLIASCSKDLSNQPVDVSSAQQAEDSGSPIPIVPPPMVVPADNPMSQVKVDLGRELFFDPNVGVPFAHTTGPNAGKTLGVSCASCHQAERAFSDKVAFSPGISDKVGTRNAPTLVNVGYFTSYTWDGKFETLEKHAPGPMFSAVEMGNNINSTKKAGGSLGYYESDPGNNDTLLMFKRLADGNNAKYVTLFVNAFGDASISLDRIVKAIACFERTIVSPGSPFDSYNRYLHQAGGSSSTISESAKRGFKLFTDPAKANCISCHSGYNFTDGTFRNNGIAAVEGDTGRFLVTRKQSDKYCYRVPTLRNVAVTGPYMHDGRYATLSQVLANYKNGGMHSINQDPAIKPLQLSDQDMTDLLAFLNSLTDGQVTETHDNQVLAPRSQASLQ